MASMWWVWVAAGLGLAIIEVLVPGYLFAGFAIGAVVVGGWMGLDLPGTTWLGASFLNSLVAMAVVSVIAWLALRQFMGIRKGQKVVIRDDINER